MTLKENEKDAYIQGKKDTYNSLRILTTCCADVANSRTTLECKIYLCFNISNIVVYPDGSISWGGADATEMDVGYTSTTMGLNAIEKTGVTQYVNNYNITQLPDHAWLSIAE